MWDLPDAPDEVAIHDTHVGNFELIVELPPIEPVAGRNINGSYEPVVDETVISLVEIDEELAEDDDIDETVDEYEDTEDVDDIDEEDDDEDSERGTNQQVFVETSEEDE